MHHWLHSCRQNDTDTNRAAVSNRHDSSNNARTIKGQAVGGVPAQACHGVVGGGVSFNMLSLG